MLKLNDLTIQARSRNRRDQPVRAQGSNPIDPSQGQSEPEQGDWKAVHLCAPSCSAHRSALGSGENIMIRKLVSGEYRLYSRKINPKTGKRRNLGTFKSRAAAEKHERDVQYFKRH
jgi:hypothetical protein